MFKKGFTADNILNVDHQPGSDGDHVIYYTVGNTESDFGVVTIMLYDIEFDEQQFDVKVELDGDNNWGLIACASALLVVAEDFPKRFPQYPLTDNTGITLA